MEDCLFCKINKGEVDSLTIYEDDSIRVLLDAFPNSTGHTLIIPKKHFKDLDDIDMETLSYIFKKAKEIKVLLEEKLNPSSIILIQNNGEAEKIKHFHLHLIPKYEDMPKMSREDVYNLLMK